MQHSRIEVRADGLQIPFRFTHRQASSVRALGDSLWVTASRGHHTGFGEGCPRSYVTGEDSTTSLNWLRRTVLREINQLASLAELRVFEHRQRELIQIAPAAWCALSSALLDLFAREADVSLEELLGISRHPTQFQYTAVIGSSPIAQAQALVTRAHRGGFRWFKVKIDGDLERDRSVLEFLRTLGYPPSAVRIDANNLFGENLDAAVTYCRSLGGGFAQVEEPFVPRRWAMLAAFADALNVAVILDESVCTMDDLQPLRDFAVPWIVNVKVSKNAGILQTLAIIAASRSRGIPLIVGAQVGETSVLTRLGILAARAAGESVIAMEGAAGEFLLERDIVEPVLQFATDGSLRLENFALGSTGLGLRLRAALVSEP